jgi:hypothetical protein
MVFRKIIVSVSWIDFMTFLTLLIMSCHVVSCSNLKINRSECKRRFILTYHYYMVSIGRIFVWCHWQCLTFSWKCGTRLQSDKWRKFVELYKMLIFNMDYVFWTAEWHLALYLWIELYTYDFYIEIVLAGGFGVTLVFCWVSLILFAINLLFPYVCRIFVCGKIASVTVFGQTVWLCQH